MRQNFRNGQYHNDIFTVYFFLIGIFCFMLLLSFINIKNNDALTICSAGQRGKFMHFIAICNLLDKNIILFMPDNKINIMFTISLHGLLFIMNATNLFGRVMIRRRKIIFNGWI